MRDSVIPQELKNLKQWVVWSKNPAGAKIPHQLNGRTASSTNPDTWATYDEVKDEPNIGFVFSPEDSYTGVDFDDCIVEGKLTPRVQEIVDNNPTYVEISPSGTGIKLWIKGDYNRVRGLNTKEIEVYSKSRYFTVTGNRLECSTESVNECPDLVRYIEEKYPQEGDVAAHEVRSAKVARVEYWIADTDLVCIQDQGGDRNLWDLAKKCNRLGLTLSETEHVMRRFNETRCNPPWSQQEMNHKIRSAQETAIKEGWFNVENYSPESFDNVASGFMALDDIEVEELDNWIFEGLIAPGCLTLLAASPKAGKTTLISNILHHCNSGGKLLGRDVRPSKVAVITEENPRLWKNRQLRDGLDIGKIDLYIQPYRLKDPVAWGEFWNRQELLSYDLIVVDTLGGVSPSIDENSSKDTLKAIDAMRYAANNNVAVLIVHHTRKGGGDAVSQVRGSSAITGAVDIIGAFTRSGKSKRERCLEVTGRFEGWESRCEWTSANGYTLVSESTDGGDESRFLECALQFGGKTVQELLSLPEAPSRTTLYRKLKEGPYYLDDGKWNLQED